MLKASGIGTYLQNIIPAVISRRPHSSYYLLGDMSALHRLDWVNKDNVQCIDCRAPIYGIREQLSLYKSIPDCDLYFSPHYNVPLLYSGELITTVHDVLHLAMPQNIRGIHRIAYARAMFAAVKRKARWIICDSAFTADELVKHTGVRRGKIRVVPLGVADCWTNLDKGSRPHHKPYVVFVGNVKPHKNLKRLVQAFHLIAERVPHDLVIVGKDEGFRTVDTEARDYSRDLRSRIRFTGFVPDDILQQYVIHADLLVLPSLYEGFGLPPLEAMACGCPCVVSNIGSLPEVCGEAAEYCDPFDVQDIAARICGVLSEPDLRARLVESGYERVKRFSWDESASALVDVIDTTLHASKISLASVPTLSEIMSDDNEFTISEKKSGQQTKRPKTAIVHDWLVTYGGAERVLKAMIEEFPDADLFSLYDFLTPDERYFIMGKPVTTSFLQRFPLARSRYRDYLPLMPLAIEQFDLSSYDLVISSSYAVAKGVITGPDQLHVCMCYSPARYAWDLTHQYLKEAGLNGSLKGWLAKYILHRIRLWDWRSSVGVDEYISISNYISRRIKKAYGRSSTVIYPPVDTDAFALSVNKEDYYLTASRMVPYKKIDLIVEAFSMMPEKRLVVIGDGPDFAKIASKAAKNIELLGYRPTEVLSRYMQRARAFVFAAEEDFGIAPVEAQACGTPVIAFGKGGALETVVEGETGVFFHDQDPGEIIRAVNYLEKNVKRFDPEIVRRNALRFSRSRFRQEFRSFVTDALRAHNNERATKTTKNVYLKGQEDSLADSPERILAG